MDRIAEPGNGKADDLDHIIIFHFFQFPFKMDHIRLRYSSNSTVSKSKKGSNRFFIKNIKVFFIKLMIVWNASQNPETEMKTIWIALSGVPRHFLWMLKGGN